MKAVYFVTYVEDNYTQKTWGAEVHFEVTSGETQVKKLVEAMEEGVISTPL